ncbi:MAG: type III pantothenate kinase [Thermodesulfovibrio sp.]|nr:type III pantothenate kinase [Thermodesulfovibrio sp.]MDW7999103.1 type III pantothenate kinase [Thermodesulfovibrio sp.]
MLVAVKIGNSTVSIAFFKDPQNSYFEIVTFNTKEVSKELNSKISGHPFFHNNYSFDLIICSVVPELTYKFIDFFRNITNRTFVIDYKTPSGLKLNLNKPESFGVDRLAACVAAHELLKENIAVIDAGTATTITVVTSEKEIIGGAIMPGIDIMNYALSEKTSSLPLVELNKDFSALGKDTHSAILSGIVLGTIYAVEGIIGEIEKEIRRKLTILLTGGYCKLISKYMHRKHLLNKYLVIEGMRLIYLRNIKS